MESDERKVLDITKKELTPGDVVAVSVENKQRIGLLKNIEWNTIKFCGKDKIYPTLNILFISSKWNKDMQRLVGLLKPYKTNKMSNLVYIGNDYIARLENKANSDIDQDILCLLKKEITKCKELKLVS